MRPDREGPTTLPFPARGGWKFALPVGERKRGGGKEKVSCSFFRGTLSQKRRRANARVGKKEKGLEGRAATSPVNSGCVLGKKKGKRGVFPGKKRKGVGVLPLAWKRTLPEGGRDTFRSCIRRKKVFFGKKEVGL